jgi:hypothetical protein
MKNKQEKSDPSTVAKMPANKPGQPGAESAEPREGTEANTGEQHTCWTPSRESLFQGLERVREAAKQRKKERFTALLHHVTIDLLKDAYSWLKREAAPGVDGRTWQSYKQNLEVNLTELTCSFGARDRPAALGRGKEIWVLRLRMSSNNANNQTKLNRGKR